MKSIYTKITLATEMLGTAPANLQIYEDWIAKGQSNSKVREELESLQAAMSLEDLIEKGMTVFHRAENGEPILYDYLMKGMFKSACGYLHGITLDKPDDVDDAEDAPKKKRGSAKGLYKSAALTSYKKKIDLGVHVYPRQLRIHVNGDITLCQRPLRAQTAQGERVALAISEEIPAGSWFVAEILCMDDKYIPMVKEWLDFGAYNGLGQWRNSGKGRISWEEISKKDYEALLG